MKPRHLLIIIIITLFSACHNNEKKAFEELITRHPDIYTEKYLKQFVMRRSLVITYPDTVKMTLFGVNSSMDDSEIVVISGKNGNTYAVPLPGYNNSYWMPYGESNNRKISASFNNEINTALKTIGIKKNSDAGYVLNDLFTSLLQWEKIKLPDSSFVKRGVNCLPDSCANLTLGNNRQMLRMSSHYAENDHDGLFWDRETARCIQLTSYYGPLSYGLTIKLYTYNSHCIIKL